MESTDRPIVEVRAWEALDSRGNPTVACRVAVEGGAVGRAIVPAGASTGRHEAAEWRDGGARLGGLGVRGAVEMIEAHVGPALIGTRTAHPRFVDDRLRAIEPPSDRRHVGSNTTLAVSVAAARAGAAARNIPLWRHLGSGGPPRLPLPMIQVLAGGVHADRIIDLQDVLVMPVGAATFSEAIEMAWCTRAAAVALARRSGHLTALVGDEGGLGIPFPSNRDAVAFVAEAIEAAGLAGRVTIAIDVAAGQLVDADGHVHLRREGRLLDRAAWIDELVGWVRDFPVGSLEDPIDEDDWEGWSCARRALPSVQLVGDDLFVTDRTRVRRGIESDVATAVLVKPNQRGTLSEAAEVVRMAADAGWTTIVSARSGETEDDWLADLAVGWGAGQIKVGSLARSERTAKWNRLLELEAFEPGATLARLSRPTGR